MQEYDVAVIGGGIVGLGIAWQVQQSGRKVVVVDPAPASGATYAAAGMLAPVTEFHHQESPLQSLMLAAARCWPEYLDGLDADVGYRTSGTLSLGVDAADRAALADLIAAQSRAGLPVQRVSSSQLRREEPLLGPQIGAFGYLAEADHQVDPRRLAEALIGSVEIIRSTAVEVGPGFIRLSDGNRLHPGEVIVANGLAARELTGLPAPLPLRPVHGDILRLGVPPELQPLVNRTVRGLVHGVAVYLVPRQDNTVVIGATQREDHREGVCAGAVYRLLQAAQTLVPAVAELTLLEATARARPGTPDNAPLLGRVAVGLLVATGMFRHGVLLSPLVAKICVDLLDDREDPQWQQFAPARFAEPSALSRGTR